MLAPFGKQPLSIRLKGITNEETALCVDFLRTVTLPLLKHFGISEGLELRIIKRGARPDGGGEVMFRCPVVKSLKAINLTDIAKVRRVRGVAYAAKVSPQVPNRVVDAAKGLLNKVLPDVYIYTDHQKGANAGASPGYGVSLVAETTNGGLFGAEACGGAGQVPEDVGAQAAKVRATSHISSLARLLLLLLRATSGIALCPQAASRGDERA